VSTSPSTRRGSDHELLCDWIEESYRIVAPKRLVAELDARQLRIASTSSAVRQRRLRAVP
jgi:hypothetical protein